MTTFDSTAPGANPSTSTTASPARDQQRVGNGDSFFVRTSDGHVMNSAEFLDLPAFGRPTVPTVIPPSHSTARRTR